ncbi:MAG: succinylglutamate desuccinylase, partial [Gammaproteobacteria bacterium]
VNYAIDLHTGAVHRSNLPQIRVHLDNPAAADMAQAFGVPVMLNAEIRDGSLRGTGDDLGIPIITYEAGEALRFDETAIVAGVNGVRSVMHHLGMIRKRASSKLVEPALARSSSWVRAPADGFFRPSAQLGDRVRKGDTIGHVSGPLDATGEPVIAAASGLIIGMNNLPQVYEGEALYHIARFESVREAESIVDTFHAQLEEDINDN